MRLVSWIGGNDLDAAEAKAGQPGAVAATLASAPFSELHLLYSYPETRVVNCLSCSLLHYGLPIAKRIAAILDKADAIRRKHQQAIKLADDFLRSVFLEIFGDPVTNPKGWEVVDIENVCSDIVDCINKIAKSVDYETPYKMIRTTNVRDMKVDLTDVRYVDKDVYEKWISRLRPEAGDIVFTREAPAGEAGVIDFDDLVFLGQRTMQFRPDKNQVASSFLLHEMMGADIKRQMEKMSSGSTVKHLSDPECKKFKVRKLPIELQIKFETLRSKTLSVLELKNKANDIPLFESLSQKAFSGMI